MEEEWFEQANTWPLLNAIRHSSPSLRKTRLLSSALCRLLFEYLPDELKHIVTENELLGDGQSTITSKELISRAYRFIPPLDTDFKSGHKREAAKAVCYAVQEGGYLFLQ